MPSTTDPAIFVHALIGNKHVTYRAMDALGITKVEAVGHLTLFWCAASLHLDDGDLSRCTDAQLDGWANWTGEPGAFARFVRTKHVDSAGKISEYAEYAGKLATHRSKEREKKQRQRHGDAPTPPNPAPASPVVPGTSRGQQGDCPGDVPGTSGGQEGDCPGDVPGTSPGQQGDALKRGEKLEVKSSPPAPAHAHTHALYGDPRTIAFFAAVPIEKHPTWCALIDRWLEGESWGAGPKPSPEEIAAGLAAAIVGKSPGQLGDRYVRSCIRTAMRAEVVRDTSPPADQPTIPPELLERAKELVHLVRNNALARGSGDQRRDILRDLVKFGDIADAAATEQALGCIAPLEDLVRPGRTFDDALRLAVARLREGVQGGRPLPPSVRPRPTIELVS